MEAISAKLETRACKSQLITKSKWWKRQFEHPVLEKSYFILKQQESAGIYSLLTFAAKADRIKGLIFISGKEVGLVLSPLMVTVL
jgi:hypothetical protein